MFIAKKLQVFSATEIATASVQWKEICSVQRNYLLFFLKCESGVGGVGVGGGDWGGGGSVIKWGGVDF